VTAEEKAENKRFIDAITTTPCVRYLHRYLVVKKLAPQGVVEFKALLHKIWFEVYGRRCGVYDSSGFEHVFVGEIKGE